MRIKYLPLTILMLAISSQMRIVRSSNVVLGKASQLVVDSSQSHHLAQETILQMSVACSDAAQLSSDRRLRELSDQLMHSVNLNNSFDLEMQRAVALIACKDPETAQQVLRRINPINSEKKRAWSMLFWQASNAVMDHSSAALALRSLSEGNLQRLDDEQITVGYSQDGTPLTRLALDLLAEHERLNGRCGVAAKVLLAGRKGGALGATRISRVAQCLDGLSVERRKDLLESALVEANADDAWWLIGDILRLQVELDLAAGGDAQIPLQRLEKYSKELDDLYTQFELIRIEKRNREKRTLLEDQLRSPRGTAPDAEKVGL